MEENPKTLRMATTWLDLPPDIITNILSRSPVKSLMQFMCVSKSWEALVLDPHFINMHLKQSRANNKGYVFMKFDRDRFSLNCHETFVEHTTLEFPFQCPLFPFEGFTVEGYCNGLFCLSCSVIDYPFYNRDIFLWNPAIRRVVVLPDWMAQCKSYPKTGHMFLSLGFVPQVNDYKVVMFVYRKLGRGRAIASCGGKLKVSPKVMVYSLRSDSWKEIRNVVPCVILSSLKYSTLNGVVHWVAGMHTVDDRYHEFILSFDMANEVFGKIELPLPVCFHDSRFYGKSLMVLNDSLCLFVRSGPWGLGYANVWVMKEYGVAESWTKEYTLDKLVDVFPLGFTKNGEVVLKGLDGDLVSYDARVQQVKDLHIPGIPNGLELFTYYMESLVLVNEEN